MNIKYMVISNLPQNILWNDKTKSGTAGPIIRLYEDVEDAKREAGELQKKFHNEYLIFPVHDPIPTWEY